MRSKETSFSPEFDVRKILEDVCIDILNRADTGRVKPKITRYKKNTVIEIKRYGAFFRLYISDKIHCSIRLNTVNESRHIDNFELYNPLCDSYLDSSSEKVFTERVRFILEDEIGLGMTFSAISQIPYAWEGETAVEYFMRDVWLDRWFNL